MSERATDCDVCFEPIPFGTLCWLRHKDRDPETNLPVVVVVCNDCHEEENRAVVELFLGEGA